MLALDALRGKWKTAVLTGIAASALGATIVSSSNSCLLYTSMVGVVVLLCLMVFRNADLGIHTGQSTILLALFFVIMTVCPHLANQLSPVPVSYTHLALLFAFLNQCIKNQKPAKHRYATRQIKKMIQKSK